MARPVYDDHGGAPELAEALSGGIENGQARLRAFPRSGFRPAVDGGLGETSWLFQPGSPGFSLLGFSC